MPPEILSVVSALAGVMLGALLNLLVTRSLKLHEWRLVLTREQIADRRKLYAEFLVHTSRLFAQSLERTVANLGELDAITTYYCQIELVASVQVIEAANGLSKDLLQLQTDGRVLESSRFYELKQAFIQAAQRELLALEGEAAKAPLRWGSRP